MENNNLLPCPFCGGDGVRIHANDPGTTAWVICDNCDADGPVARSEAVAITAWNTRAGADPNTRPAPYGPCDVEIDKTAPSKELRLAQNEIRALRNEVEHKCALVASYRKQVGMKHDEANRYLNEMVDAKKERDTLRARVEALEEALRPHTVIGATIEQCEAAHKVLNPETTCKKQPS